jgi:hypothetical protein
VEVSPQDVWGIGGLLLGFVLAMLKRPWWFVPLVVSILTACLMPGKEWALVAKEPAWLFVGIGFYSLPALFGWLFGRMLLG